MRWLAVAMLVLSGCGIDARIKKLSPEEYKAYYALRPFMSEDDKKTYLKLKTEEERKQWMKDKGLWDAFYKYDETIRQAIVDGAVRTGWNEEMVYMAWGAPYDSQKLTGRRAVRSQLLVYRFEKQEDGTILVWAPGSKTEYKSIEHFRREVYIDDNVVTEIVEKKGWEG